MAEKRKKYTAEFKAQIVVNLLSEKKSTTQICKEFGLKDSMVSRWKAEFLKKAPLLFESPHEGNSSQEQKIAELERMIGKLTVELSILKKASQLLNCL